MPSACSSLGELLGAVLGAAEDDRQLRVLLLEQHPQQPILVPGLDGEVILLDLLDGRLVVGAGRDQLFDRLAHVRQRRSLAECERRSSVRCLAGAS